MKYIFTVKNLFDKCPKQMNKININNAPQKNK